MIKTNSVASVIVGLGMLVSFSNKALAADASAEEAAIRSLNQKVLLS